MGVRQLYYGENDSFVAFASERKALWKVGVKEPTKCIAWTCNTYKIKWPFKRTEVAHAPA